MAKTQSADFKKGSYALVHDDEIQRAVPAEDWERVKGALNDDRLTKIYPTRLGCRDRKHVSDKLTAMGFVLPAFVPKPARKPKPA